MLKNPPTNAGDLSLIKGLGISPGEGNGNQLQYFCLENPMDRGTWWTTVHYIAESDTTELLSNNNIHVKNITAPLLLKKYRLIIYWIQTLFNSWQTYKIDLGQLNIHMWIIYFIYTYIVLYKTLQCPQYFVGSFSNSLI